MTTERSVPSVLRPASIFFRIIGEPIPQGSMKGYVRGGRVALTSDNPRLHNWRDIIGWEARKHVEALITGPVGVDAMFFLTRPKSCPKSRVWPAVKPDSDKLARALLDALTGVVWADDAQVIQLNVLKTYAQLGEQPGAAIKVWTL